MDRLDKSIRMNYLSFLLFFSICITSSCSNTPSCYELGVNIASTINCNPEEFMGFTIESRNFRDAENKIVRPVEYVDEGKSKTLFYMTKEGGRFVLDENKTDSNNVIFVARDINLAKSNLYALGVNHIERIVNIYADMSIMAISSQRHLGSVVEFKINKSCSVFFKAEDNLLANYERLFSKNDSISNHWYFSPPPND